jgi:hypothetical protein
MYFSVFPSLCSPPLSGNLVYQFAWRGVNDRHKPGYQKLGQEAAHSTDLSLSCEAVREVV